MYSCRCRWVIIDLLYKERVVGRGVLDATTIMHHPPFHAPTLVFITYFCTLSLPCNPSETPFSTSCTHHSALNPLFYLLYYPLLCTNPFRYLPPLPLLPPSTLQVTGVAAFTNTSSYGAPGKKTVYYLITTNTGAIGVSTNQGAAWNYTATNGSLRQALIHLLTYSFIYLTIWCLAHTPLTYPLIHPPTHLLAYHTL